MRYAVLSACLFLLLGPIAYWSDVKKGAEIPTGKTKLLALGSIFVGVIMYTVSFFI